MHAHAELPPANECRKLSRASSLREFEDFRSASIHRLKVALQHPDVFCVSAKSFAAHLAGLCIGVESESNPFLMTALQKWPNGRRLIENPTLQGTFCSTTIADVMKSETQAEYHRAARLWAERVWAATRRTTRSHARGVKPAKDFVSRSRWAAGPREKSPATKDPLLRLAERGRRLKKKSTLAPG